jgi:uncharacterized membrane protein
MSKVQSITYTYRIQVFYRFVVAFIIGFICAALLSLDLTYLLNHQLPKAEAIYLAAFISLIFYACYVITSFCIQSLLRLTILSCGIFGCVFLLFLGMR